MKRAGGLNTANVKPMPLIQCSRRCIGQSKITVGREMKRLAGRPVHRSAAEHVQVKVGYSLAGGLAVVNYDTEPIGNRFWRASPQQFCASAR